LDRTRVKERVVLQPAAHHDDSAVRIAEARRAVLRLAQDRRITAVEERVRHCGGGFAGAAGEYLGRGGVALSSASSVIRRLPKSSTVRAWPGSTTVVESYCSTMAGPAMGSSASRRARSYTYALANSALVRS